MLKINSTNSKIFNYTKKNVTLPFFSQNGTQYYLFFRDSDRVIRCLSLNNCMCLDDAYVSIEHAIREFDKDEQIVDAKIVFERMCDDD